MGKINKLTLGQKKVKKNNKEGKKGDKQRMGHTCTVFWLPVFNLEISQSIPHDILNWVISKMV